MTLVLLLCLGAALAAAVVLAVELRRERARHRTGDPEPAAPAAPEPAKTAVPTQREAEPPKAEATPESDRDVALDALWTLESARLDRQWSLATPGVAPPPTRHEGHEPLVRALAMELDLLRDDVGVPGSLVVDLDDEEEATTLVVLRTVQEMLAAVARTADEVEIAIVQQNGLTVCEVRVNPQRDESDQALEVPPAVQEAVAILGGSAHSGPQQMSVSVPRAGRKQSGPATPQPQLPTGPTAQHQPRPSR